MPIFFTLSQDNAQRLQDVTGGDEARVNFLTTALGQQLVGRAGLTPAQQDLLQVGYCIVVQASEAITTQDFALVAFNVLWVDCSAVACVWMFTW